MTTNETDDTTRSNEIIAAGLAAAERLRDHAAAIEKTRDEQPQRLTEARTAAEEARGWALLEEPWDDQWCAVPGYNQNGDITALLAVPNLTAKELWGARLCFDILDCGDDYDRIDEVLARLFTMVHGDTGMAFLLATSALSTIAALVVPQLLDAIEHGGDYDERARLAEARAKAWNGRVADIRRGEPPQGSDR